MTSASVAAAGFPTVGVVGAGQLARMMAPAAVNLGVGLRVLAADLADSAALAVRCAPVGSHTDPEALSRLASSSDVLTFDHEHVPTALLRALQDEGHRVRPGPDALEHAQDKLLMRRRLSALGVPCPRWAQVRTVSQVQDFGDEVGWPVVLKTPRGGYDGKGVRVLHTAVGAREWLAAADGDAGLLAEQRVAFVRELAVLVARSPAGQAAAWPVVQTEQRAGVCRAVVAPAPGLAPATAAAATGIALQLAADLGVCGVLAVEMFELARPGPAAPAPPAAPVLVNELAMRPHNSGHWTIDGAITSQFEQHLRAVLDLPLGDPRPRAPWSVMVNVLGAPAAEPSDAGERARRADLYRSLLHVMARDPAAKVHLYGKAFRPGRKLGHVTCYGEDLDGVRARAEHAASFIAGEIDE